MRIRLAKKIYTRDAGSIRYITTDISKNRKKTKKYWEYRWYLYFANIACMNYGRKDHRIVKAIILYARWCARKQINRLVVYAKASPLRYRDLSRFTKRLKKYKV